jgi:hypothetical protein
MLFSIRTDVMKRRKEGKEKQSKAGGFMKRGKLSEPPSRPTGRQTV